MSLDDKYTYPGSGGVLRNRLGITDRTALDEAMNDYASAAWAALSLEEPERPDFDYLCRVHKTMLGRLFPWAGKIRDVDTGAGNTGIVYARPAFLDDNLADLFRQLEREDYLADLPGPDEFVRVLAVRWATLTQLHPFRDGNTRSQSLFVSQLARRAGHPIAWSRVDVEELRRLRLRAIMGHDEDFAQYLHTLVVDEATAAREPTHVLSGAMSGSSGVAILVADGSGDTCGRWMKRAKTDCVLPAGHRGHCRSVLPSR